MKLDVRDQRWKGLILLMVLTLAVQSCRPAPEIAAPAPDLALPGISPVTSIEAFSQIIQGIAAEVTPAVVHISASS